ncbi:hypothetical protein VULLAG_LOCUS262 [Vulpes lagopus]
MLYALGHYWYLRTTG